MEHWRAVCDKEL